MMRRVSLLTPFLMCSLFVVHADSQDRDGRVRNPETTLQDIQHAIEERGAQWIAAQTEVSRLSKEERRTLCGAMAGRSSTNLSALEQVWGYPGQPDRFDWRDVEGKNWTTPIRDQQGCGSCIAFASIGALEAVAEIYHGDSNLNMNLSEQHIFSCGGGRCDDGWNFRRAFSYLRDYGAPDERCYPYGSGDGEDLPCQGTCTDWRSRTVSVSCWGYVFGAISTASPPARVKEKLLEGPLAAHMVVYEDFIYYAGGVYEHVAGEELGGHGVVIVGWDDTAHPPCWICKNSWGRGWGEAGGGETGGWFRIRMGINDCDIEVQPIWSVMGDIPEINMPETFHDFGTVDIGDTVEWILPVSNLGAGDLKIYEVNIDSEHFNVTPGDFPKFVEPDGICPLTFTFAPSAIDAQAAIANIRSNDCDVPGFWVWLKGTGEVPRKVAIELKGSCGLPGDMFTLALKMDNQKYREVPCSLVELNICFDDARTAVADVAPTERVERFTFFDWEVCSPGTLRVSASDTSGECIEAGTGPIATIRFSVAEDTRFGQIIPTTIQDLLVADATGQPIEAEILDGYISISFKGDVNSDCDLTVSDVLQAANIVSKSIPHPTSHQLWAADCNGSTGRCVGDGVVNVLDLVKIVRLILDLEDCP